MSELEPHQIETFEAATHKLIRQADQTEIIEHISNDQGLEEDDAIALATSVVAGGFIREARNVGQQAEGLSVWHTVVTKMCSERFEQLSIQSPNASRAEIRTDIELRKLNAIRRGVGQAMRDSYKTANTSKRRHRSSLVDSIK